MASTNTITDDWSLYAYGKPSQAAASLFFVLFFISAVMHVAQLFKFGIARYSAFLPWAGLVYTAGFVMRAVSSFHTQDISQFIASTVLLYAAPPIYAAVNYLVLGRVLHYVPSKSPLHPGRVVTTYLGLDVIVEALTGNGGWRIGAADNPNDLRVGRILIEISLILQVVLYCSFTVLQVVVYRRCARAGIRSPNLRGIMLLLLVSTSLIQVRSVYRVIDAFLGSQGYTETHEWPLYVFDALPILVNTYMFNIFHPALFLPPSSKVYLGADGVTERMGPGWTDIRPFLATLFDPFDIAGIISKRDHKNRFWEEEDQHPKVDFEPSKHDEDALSSRWWARLVGPLRLEGLCALYAERRAKQNWLKHQSTSRA